MTGNHARNSFLSRRILNFTALSLFIIAGGWFVISFNRNYEIKTEGVDMSSAKSAERPFGGVTKKEMSPDQNNYVNIRRNLLASSTPEKELLNIVSEINRLSGLDKDYAITLFLSNLTEFESSEEAISWLVNNRDLLNKTLSTLKVGEGRSAYEDVLERIENVCMMEGEDFISVIRGQSNKNLKIDVLPLELAATGAWDNSLLSSLDEKTRLAIEERTIRRLAVARFSNDKALEMLLDDDCSIISNQKLVTQVISRDYFWRHSDQMLRLVENANPSQKKDDALMRVVELIGERDNDSAKQWAKLINDEVKRLEAVKRLPSE